MKGNFSLESDRADDKVFYNENPVLGCFIILVSCAGFIGNLLVIITVLKSGKGLHSAHYTFILSLSVADCLVTSFNGPVSGLTMLLGVGVVNPALCKAEGFFITTSIGASILGIYAIALNRYTSIIHPAKFRKIYTKRNTGLQLACLWISAMALATKPLVGMGSYALDPHILICLQDWTSAKIHSVIIICIGPVGTNIVNIFCYTRVFHRVRLSRRRVQQHMPSTVNNRQRREEVNLIAQLFLIFLIFNICWIPYYVVMILEILQVRVPSEVHQPVGMLVLANSCLNPPIYFFFNKSFCQSCRRQNTTTAGTENTTITCTQTATITGTQNTIITGTHGRHDKITTISSQNEEV